MNSIDILTNNYKAISNYVNAHRNAKIAANSATRIEFEYLLTHTDSIGLWFIVFLTHLPLLSFKNNCNKEIITIAESYSYHPN